MAHLVWDTFGDVSNYVEPFFGSGAVLLGRPSEPRIETVNDLDCFVSNFWRAVYEAPDQVAGFADWPVNEADLHARHRWLVATVAPFRKKMRTDPHYFDAKRAGWWLWGICQWIGAGWCTNPEWTGRRPATRPTCGSHAILATRGRNGRRSGGTMCSRVEGRTSGQRGRRWTGPRQRCARSLRRGSRGRSLQQIHDASLRFAA